MKASFLLALALAAGSSASAAPPDAPGDMDGYDAYQGQALHFMVQGASGGSVWGTDVYTLDSAVAAAAVHAGAVRSGEKKEVVIVPLPGQQSYRGSTRNGITTRDYGEFRASYRFLKSGEAEPKDGRNPLETPNNVLAFKPRTGETLVFKVTGSTEGGVWGTGEYSADSSLAAAAVHAGMIKPGETANLRVTILPGRRFYHGSESHGVTSAEYEEFDSSFRFETKPAENSDAGAAAKSQPLDKGVPPHL